MVRSLSILLLPGIPKSVLIVLASKGEEEENTRKHGQYAVIHSDPLFERALELGPSRRLELGKVYS